MYVRDLLLSLLRRWYIIVAGLLVTAALCGVAFIKIPLTYEATGSVLLLPPKSSVGSRGNPYLYLGGLAQAVEVLSARLNASTIRKPIEESHPDTTFDVGQDQTSTGPLLSVSVSSNSEAETLAVVKAVMAEVPRALTGMQDDLQIPEGSRIGSLILTDPTEATELSKTRSRGVIALAGVGVAGTVLLAGLLDGLLMARTRRRQAIDPSPGWVSTPSAGPDPSGGPTKPKQTPAAERHTIAGSNGRARSTGAAADDSTTDVKDSDTPASTPSTSAPSTSTTST